MKFGKFSIAPPAAASKFCSGGYVRIVSVSKYINVNDVKKSM